MFQEYLLRSDHVDRGGRARGMSASTHISPANGRADGGSTHCNKGC